MQNVWLTSSAMGETSWAVFLHFVHLSLYFCCGFCFNTTPRTWTVIAEVLLGQGEIRVHPSCWCTFFEWSFLSPGVLHDWHCLHLLHLLHEGNKDGQWPRVRWSVCTIQNKWYSSKDSLRLIIPSDLCPFSPVMYSHTIKQTWHLSVPALLMV